MEIQEAATNLALAKLNDAELMATVKAALEAKMDREIADHLMSLQNVTDSQAPSDAE